jgi:16S rRNA processing protein RimM
MRLIVGRIGRPHGVRGEAVIGVRTDEPDLRFTVGAVLDVDRTLPAGEDAAGGGQLTVASARWHSGQLLVTFTGITDRTAAGELTGSWLSVDSSQLPEPSDPDEFRDYELIGLSVRTSAGDPVGVVTDVLHYGQDLLVVQAAPGQASPDEAGPDRARQDKAGPGKGGPDKAGEDKSGEYLVPFVKAIVPEVDVSAGVLVIDPPPGLIDPVQAE